VRAEHCMGTLCKRSTLNIPLLLCSTLLAHMDYNTPIGRQTSTCKLILTGSPDARHRNRTATNLHA